MFKDFKIKIFADGADLKSVENLNREEFIKGFTTNPSLMKKAGVTDYKAFSIDLIKLIGKKPISLEVFTDDIEEMEKQAKEISSWGDNVFVKIPITNTKGETTVGLVKKLLDSGVKCNVTAVFTLKQVKQIYEKANNKTNLIISIFSGRIADSGRNPIKTIEELEVVSNQNLAIEMYLIRLIYLSPNKQGKDMENNKTKLLVEKDSNYTSKNDVVNQIKNITLRVKMQQNE